MKIHRSLLFAFRSPNGPSKILVGGLFTALFFTVFLPFTAAGFLVRLMCDLLEGRDAALPDWKDLGGMFYDGLQPILIALAYVSPFIIFSVFRFYFDTIIFSILQIFCIVAVSALLPLGLIHFITTRSIEAAFDIKGSIVFIRNHFRSVFTAWGVSVLLHGIAVLLCIGVWLGTALLVSLVASKIAGISAGLILGFLVFAFSDFIVTVISSHLYAQAYRASKPFSDDVEGIVRASVVLPPSLSKRQL